MLAPRVVASCSLVLVLTVATAGCGSGGSGDSMSPATTSASVPSDTGELRPATTPTPRLRVQGFGTRGVVPQVAGAGASVGRANAVLLKAVTADQRAFITQAGALIAATNRPSMMYGSMPQTVGRQTYSTTAPAALMSVSPVVVSALIPVTRGTLFQPQDYVSATIDMRSGRAVAFDDLFTRPAAARAAIARVAATGLGADACVRKLPSSYVRRGTRPTAANYATFALLQSGLTVGYGGDVTACGRRAAIVPYAAVRDELSPLGRRLVAGARASGT